MKALSIKDPWATLVAYGCKVYETRSWATPFRGPVALHASKAFSREDQYLALEDPFRSTLLGLIPRGLPSTLNDWPRGHVIAVADLVDVVKIARIGPNERPIHCNEREGLHPHGPRDVVTAGSEPVEELEAAFGLYCSHRYAWRFENVRRIRPVRATGALGLWTWGGPVEVLP